MQPSVFAGPHPGQRVLVVRVRELRGERRLRAQVHADSPHLQPEVNTTTNLLTPLMLKTHFKVYLNCYSTLIGVAQLINKVNFVCWSSA